MGPEPEAIFTATKTSYTYLATEDANTSGVVSETKYKSDMARIEIPSILGI